MVCCCVQIRVRVLGSLRETMKNNDVSLDLNDDVCLEGLIKTLISAYPQIETNLWDRVIESYSSNALVLVNGVEAGNLEGLRTKLEDGDEIVILSVTHGG
jgi:molybdopterin converting factor small subunit